MVGFMAWGRLGLLAGVSSLALGAAAAAQDAGAQGVTRLSLDKIVVTAGADKVAADTPQAVTVLDQNDIDQAQASTIGDLLEDVPGVSLQGGVSALGQGFNIRGLGTGVADSDSRILMQVDGVTKFFEQYRVGSFFSEPDLYKRVEVLRGPASSTLYGAGALAGVVNFETKDASDFLAADDDFAVRLKGEMQSNGPSLAGSVILAARPTANLDLLGVYTRREADDYEDGERRPVSPSGVSSESYLAKARYYIGGERGHNVWASYQNWLSDSTQIYDQAEAFGSTPVRRKVDDTTATLGYQNDFGGSRWFNLKAQGSYADSSVLQTETTFLGPLSSSEFTYRSTQGRIENQSRYSLGEGLDGFLFVGVQASKQERRNPRISLGGTVTPGGATHPEGDMTKLGAFIQNELIWQDRLTVITGVRFDRSEFKPGLNVAATATDRDGVSPKIAAIYALNDNVSVFASAARTVRIPVLDELYSRTNASATNYSLDLRPEESENIEAGFSVSSDRLFGGRARLKTTAYRNKVEDLIQRPVIVPPATALGTPYFVNVGAATFEGVELEAEYARGPVFLRAIASTSEGVNDITRAPLTSIPADELDITVGYVVAALDLTVGYRVEIAGRQDEVPTLNLVTPGYTVHNLFASWKPQDGPFAGLDVRVSVDNLTDKLYRRHLVSTAFPDPGRNFKLSLARTF